MPAAPWNHDGVYDIYCDELFSLRECDDWFFAYRLAMILAEEQDDDEPVNLKFDGSNWFVYRDGSFEFEEDE